MPTYDVNRQRKPRAPKPKPACIGWVAWLYAAHPRLFPQGSLAFLTGQDVKQVEASLHLALVWGTSDATGARAAAEAYGILVRSMRAETRPVAKALIPKVLDWEHERRLWRETAPWHLDFAEGGAQ